VPAGDPGRHRYEFNRGKDAVDIDYVLKASKQDVTKLTYTDVFGLHWVRGKYTNQALAPAFRLNFDHVSRPVPSEPWQRN